MSDPGRVFTSKVGHYTSWLVSQSSLSLTYMSQVQLVHQVHFPLVHYGPASWLFSSLFSEKFSDSGRSNVGSGGVRLLAEECS